MLFPFLRARIISGEYTEDDLGRTSMVIILFEANQKYRNETLVIQKICIQYAMHNETIVSPSISFHHQEFLSLYRHSSIDQDEIPICMLTILRYLAVQLYYYATTFIQTLIHHHERNDRSLAVKLKLMKCHTIDIIIELATIRRRMNLSNHLILLPGEEQEKSNRPSINNLSPKEEQAKSNSQSTQSTPNVMYDNMLLGTPRNRAQLPSNGLAVKMFLITRVNPKVIFNPIQISKDRDFVFTISVYVYCRILEDKEGDGGLSAVLLRVRKSRVRVRGMYCVSCRSFGK